MVAVVEGSPETLHVKTFYLFIIPGNYLLQTVNA